VLQPDFTVVAEAPRSTGPPGSSLKVVAAAEPQSLPLSCGPVTNDFSSGAGPLRSCDHGIVAGSAAAGVSLRGTERGGPDAITAGANVEMREASPSRASQHAPRTTSPEAIEPSLTRTMPFTTWLPKWTASRPKAIRHDDGVVDCCNVMWYRLPQMATGRSASVTYRARSANCKL